MYISLFAKNLTQNANLFDASDGFAGVNVDEYTSIFGIVTVFVCFFDCDKT